VSDPTDRPLRLVLDTSAIAAWTRGSISVGELLAEIDLEPDDWRMLVGLRQILGSADLASAAWNALDTGLDVLTAHSRLYADLGGGSLAIQIED